MCILFMSTDHPEYSLVLLSNRDEFFARPTGLARFWDPPFDNVLRPYDAAREEHGTWIGVTTEGRLAVVLNFQEQNMANAISKLSRGILPRDFLESKLDAEEWQKEVLSKYQLDKFDNIGGFSFVHGLLQPRITPHGTAVKPLRIVSNRGDPCHVLEKETDMGLSNSHFTEPWPKVIKGKKLLREVIGKSVEDSWDKEQLIEGLIGVLSTNTYPATLSGSADMLESLKHSIFVPPVDVSTTPVPVSPVPETASGAEGAEPSRSLDAAVLDEMLEKTQAAEGSEGSDKAEVKELKELKNSGAGVNSKSVRENGNPQQSSEGSSSMNSKSIIGLAGRYYGTRTQTVILVDNKGHLTYVEHTCHSSDDVANDKPQRQVFEFDIKGWEAEK